MYSNTSAYLSVTDNHHSMQHFACVYTCIVYICVHIKLHYICMCIT